MGGSRSADAPLESASWVEAVTTAAPMMLWASDASGKMVYVSDRWLAHTGRALEEEAGDGWLQALHPDDRDPCLDKFKRALVARGPFETTYRLRRTDGAFSWFLSSGRARFQGREFLGYAGVCVECLYRDEERQKTPDTTSYRALAEAIPALILTTTADGEVEFCNSRLLDYCGTDIEGLQGAHWVDFIHPEDVRTGREGWLRRIDTGAAFSSEYRIRRADGAYLWHLTHTAPLRNARGDTYGWVAASIDVDARHRAEEDALRIAEELHRASAAKDEFLGMVSHELRTPITTIYGNAQVLRRTSGQLDIETLWHSFSDIEQEAMRLQQLIDNMFVLARVEAGAPMLTEPIMLGRIVEKVVREHQLRYPGRAVTVNDDAGMEPVCGEQLYVEQVIRNLLSNAHKYSLPQEPIFISLDRSKTSGAVRVLDRGVRMPEEEVARLLEAFYRSPRSAEVVAGAGIGLTVCKRLVEAMGGEIWVQSREDGGLEAGFSLPLETEGI